MSAEATASEGAGFGPWNPGIRSELPAAYVPLSTMFRPDNVFTGLDEARELSDFTGLAPEELVVFRPERLAVHELLVRVTADFSVPEKLGVNFRRIAGDILARYIEPRMDEIVDAYERLRRDALVLIQAELTATVFAAPAPAGATGGRLSRLMGGGHRKRAAPRAPADSIAEKERRFRADWRAKAEAAEDGLEKAVYAALLAVANAVGGRHGRLRGSPDLLARLAADRVCNGHGGEHIGRLIEPHIRAAVAGGSYPQVPAQARPLVMNIKGASAAGKSTMRPLQRSLAERLGIPWADFAVISPDIWRKFLLDFRSLGAAYKYAGTLTGQEIQIIDQKLDRYMARKAKEGRMSHLLIDRFRFDSFASEPDAEEGSGLLTRFGDTVYMFFMITPPDATVERAWARGLQVGRYKAVDDLLDHNVEAYTGMPRLFFTWALRADKSVHYEFLDNSVAQGERPRTVAFGWNGEMNILDVKCLLDVDRYRKINIEARAPEEVYPDADAMAPENNTEFLRQCARAIPVLNFVDRETGLVYARMEQGSLRPADALALTRAIEDEETRAGLGALAPEAPIDPGTVPGPSQTLTPAQAHTLGQWGEGAHPVVSSPLRGEG